MSSWHKSRMDSLPCSEAARAYERAIRAAPGSEIRRAWHLASLWIIYPGSYGEERSYAAAQYLKASDEEEPAARKLLLERES